MYPVLSDPNRPAAAMPVTVHDRSIFEIMWSVRGKLIVFAVIGLLLGVAAWLTRPSVYEATSQIYVQRPPTSGQANPFRSEGATAAGPSAQEAILRSESVLNAALVRPGIGDGPVLTKERDPVAFLAKEVDIAVSEDKETLTLSFASTDPQEAADVLNAIVDEFIIAQSRRANLLINDAIESPEAQLSAEEQEQRRQQAAELAKRFTVSVGSREMMSRLAEQQLNRLSDAVIESELALEAANTRLSAARATYGDFDALLQLSMDQASGVKEDASAVAQIRRLEIATADAEKRLASAEQFMGKRHTFYRSYLTNAQTLREQLDTARETAAANLLDGFTKARDQAQARTELLRERVDTMQRAADQIAQLAIEVLSPAHPPRKPAGPKLPIFAAVGTVLGIALATFLGLIGEVRHLADATAQAEANGLTALPAPDMAGWALGTSPVAALPAPASTGWNRPAPAAEPPPLLGTIPRLAATHRMIGPGYDRAADSVHQFRAVLLAIARQRELRTVAFVSPRRGTGRTSVTVGLASSLATADVRVLAVDADLAGRIARRQTAEAAQAQPAPNADTGLTALAQRSGHFVGESGKAVPSPDANGDGHAPQAPHGIAGFLDGLPLEECIKFASNDRLAFLPANNAEDRHLGIFSDRKITDLVAQTRDAYDLILFDAGPIPGSLEAFTVASVVEGVVIVVEENQDMAEYQRTLQHLRVINANVLGVVVNKAQRVAGSEIPEDGQAPETEGSEFAAAGSGILAASVFTDQQSGYQEEDWELTSINELLPDEDGEGIEALKTTSPDDARGGA
ncbi:MAG: AAA family ATPase [Planctomycetota bacterium]